MSSDKEEKKKSIVPVGEPRLIRYSSRLIQRGLDLAKELDKSEAGLEVSRQTSEITTPQKLIWKCIRTLIGHLNVYSVAISPDGQTLASCGDDKTIKIWNLNTGDLLRTFTGHSDIVWSVTFSPDGQILASCSEDKTVKIWKLDTGELLSTLLGHSEAVVSITFSPDGKILVSGSGDKTVKVWNLSTGTQLHTLSGYSGAILWLAISPNGQTLVTGSEYSGIKLWELATGNFLGTFSELYFLATISLDGKTLAYASDWNSSRTIELWNLESDELLCYLATESEVNNQYSSIAVSSEGKNVAGGTEDGTIKIFDRDIGKLIYILCGHSKSVLSVTFSPDGQTLVSGGSDGSINIWRMSPSAETEDTIRQTQLWNCVHTLTGHSSNVSSVAISSDGQTLASGSWDNTIKLWNLHTGKRLHTLDAHSSSVLSVVISPDGQKLASGHSGGLLDRSFGSINIWDLNTGELLHNIGGYGEVLAINPSEKTLVSSSFSSTTSPTLIDVWSLDTGERLRTFSTKQFDHMCFSIGLSSPLPDFCFKIESLAISSDGQMLASGTNDGKIHLWNLYTGEIVHTFTGHLFEVVSVTFNPDGQFLASASEDGTVKLWDLHTKALVHTLPAGFSDIDDPTSVRLVAFSSNGQTLASASWAFMTWNVSTGERLYTSGSGIVSSVVAFSPHQQTIVSGFGNDIEVWQLSPVTMIGVSDPTA
ncbi:WD40 repeat domain-containing protein [Microcoleus sp. FACHB-53]|nr:WD40 repeat domain-containing protein [Microcoleus sp. FACHB-53]